MTHSEKYILHTLKWRHESEAFPLTALKEIQIMGLESLSAHGKVDATAHPASHPEHTPTLSERLYSLGSSVVNSAEEKLHTAEHFVSEHKTLSAAAGIATAAVVGIAAIATRGKAAEMGTLAEDALSLSAKEGSSALAHGGGLAGEAARLMGSSTLRRAAALGVVPLAALTLAGCEEEQEKAAVYKDANECAKDGIFTKQHCDEEYAAAKKLHDQTSPKFKNEKECEDKTGVQCKADDAPTGNTNTGTGIYPYMWYRPWMYGFMASQNRDSNNTWRSTPIYSTPHEGDLVTSHGESLGTKKSGSTMVTRETFENASKPVSTGAVHETSESETFSHGEAFSEHVGGISRGGFGGEAEAGGFHGGGFHGSVGE